MHAIIILILCLVPAVGYSLCLQNCQQETARMVDSRSFSSPHDVVSNSPYGRGPISAGDVKNGVFGDMNIRVGHERVDVRTDSNSNNNTIDATINSTIILGDMKQ